MHICVLHDSISLVACHRFNLSSFAANITPTVELNALAMKRGEPAKYTVLETLRPAGQQLASGANALNFRGIHNQR